MYISRLAIRNYRTFQDFVIQLKPLTLIIGENNVGKTNLLDSIGLILGQDISFFKKRMLEVADFNYDVMLEFKRKVLDFAIPIEDIEFPEIFIEATLKDWDKDQESVIADWFSNSDMSEAKLTYSFKPVGKFVKKEELEFQRAFIKKFIDDNGQECYQNLSEAARLDLINFPISKYYYTLTGGADASAAVNTYHLNQLRFEFLDALRDAGTELVASHHSRLLYRILNSKEEREYQDLKGQLVGLQAAIDDNAALKTIKKGISEQLDKISLAVDDTTNLVNLIFTLPDVGDLLKKISLVYGDNPITIDRNGTGRNNLLFISLVLSYIEDITRGHSSYFRVVGLEEPESHLHPNLQDHLAHNIDDLIKNESKDAYRKDIQLLITSHSTHITTKIDYENTVVLFKDNKKLKAHYILDGFSDTALGKRQIKYLNKYLDAVNTNIFYSSKIILVEGISEKLLLPVFFQRLNNATTEKLGCCIVNVNGLAFSYFLEIIKNGFFRKCLVLTDRDSETKTKDRADNLAEKYKGVADITVGITEASTFEIDLINANTKGQGRKILLEVIKEVRPNSGKKYCEELKAKPISAEEYFALIKEYKSEFAYSLMLMLSEQKYSKDKTCFNVPEYIERGITSLNDDTKTATK
ncbi:AAA family ATPase [Flavobacterium sp. WW92]|uniref:ATP-dependent nuclease n=1 Tax=unclassified Flavobacterium TaxID=196869 RepID=UPI0022241114|nr:MULTISPECIES: AAA family ATPase [unclassified Flavobacterium]WDO12345.1 AAA family ATPase [Flavobacterium sp. WW92]